MSDDVKYLAALQVTCPRCNAQPDAKCVRINPAAYKPGTAMSVCHAARYTAAGVGIIEPNLMGGHSVSPCPVQTITAGCGETGPLGEVCGQHVKEVEFDGFTVNWHSQTAPDGRSKMMWRNGPSIRPTRTPATWESIVGQIHPEWPGASENTQRRIRNAAWANGYTVDAITGIVRRGK